MEDRAHRYDRCVIDKEYMFDGHGRDLCNEDPPQGIGYSGAGPYELELHVHALYPIDDHPEVLLEFLE